MNNNVNSFQFNTRGVNPDSKGPQKESVQDEENQVLQEKTPGRTLLPQEAALDYLVNMGKLNIVLTKGSAVDVDPSKHLSQERINDIEASMQKFEELYQQNLNIIESEFGNTLSQAAKEELAWRTLA